jgi:hypothetical protein
MRFGIVSPLLLSTSLAIAQSANKLGYDCHPTCIASTIPEDKKFDFGRYYAVLNLDLINVIVEAIEDTPAGKTFINSTAKWIDAVHAQDPAPLSIFTRI